MAFDDQRALAASLGLLPLQPTTPHDDDDDEPDRRRRDNPQQPCNAAGISRGAGNSYAVSRRWLRRWIDHITAVAGSRSPGPIEMTTRRCAPGPDSSAAGLDRTSSDEDDDGGEDAENSSSSRRNEYVPEAAWRRLADWYGVADAHRLDRKLLNGAASFNDRVEFEVCVLSAFCGIVEHPTRRFNRFEEVGVVVLFGVQRIIGV